MTKRRSRGFSLLELTVSLVILLLLAGVLFSILPRYRTIVERDMVDINIRSMRTGLRLQVSQWLLAGRQKDLVTLVGVNPVQWLSGGLPNYLGEFEAPPASDVRGCWYFDKVTRQLVFRSKSSILPSQEDLEIHWQVVPSGGKDTGVQLLEVESKSKT
jgi:prepilin-type N-terminal cleavage/methylation domain-containing protein